MHTRAAVDCMAGLIISSQLIQQTDTANTAMQEMIEYTTSLNDSSYVLITESCRVRLSILQGKKSATSTLHNNPPQNENMLFWIEIPSITFCKVLLSDESDKSLQEAEKCLLDLLQRCNDSHNVYQKNILMPILALVYNKQQRVNEALDVLKESIKLTISEYWMQPFIESGTAMSNLLKQLMVKDVTLAEHERDYITQIMNAFSATIQASQSEQTSMTTEQLIPVKFQVQDSYLTSREIQILILLKQRLSNKEIGEKLFISMETVKSHMKNIFTKLEVGHRKEAVIKANELGFYDIS